MVQSDGAGLSPGQVHQRSASQPLERDATHEAYLQALDELGIIREESDSMDALLSGRPAGGSSSQG